MAWVGLVVGQFHAMARHNTADGSSDLDSWTTRVWSDPARDFFSPLLDWASPDAVYMTYGKIWFPVFAAFTACAYVLYQRRRPTGFEKFAWRFALVAYVWGVLAVFVTYWTQWTPPTPPSSWTWPSCSSTSRQCSSAGWARRCSASR